MPAPAPQQIALAAGTLLRLAPVEATAEVPAAFFDGLWREALRQSPRFDVASGVEDLEAAEHTIELFCDPRAPALSSTLRRPGQPPLPLAGVRGDDPVAIDALALATRQALGEEVRALPLASAAIYSANAHCVRQTEDGWRQLAAGRTEAAIQRLRRARTLDPGCTITLALLAQALLARGSERGDSAAVEEARRGATQALQLASRTAPTTRHRLAHTALVAASRTGDPRAADEELLTLGTVASRERPHDPHVMRTRAIALNLLQRYEESLPALRTLRARWPRSAEIAYHAAFAELCAGDAEAAVDAARDAARTVPPHLSLVPTALTLHAAGRHDELDRLLDRWLARAGDGAGGHELYRMRAAHALLTDRGDRAADALLADLEWLRRRPSEFSARALELVEAGEVLVWIGRHEDLAVRLSAFEALHDGAPVLSAALIYLNGLCEIARTDQPATAAEAHLQRTGHTVWRGALRAAAHQRRGELLDELNQRMQLYVGTEAPLPRAALARVLRALGSDAQAETVRAELRARLHKVDLRALHLHPLMSPAAALALLGT